MSKIIRKEIETNAFKYFNWFWEQVIWRKIQIDYLNFYNQNVKLLSLNEEELAVF